MNDQVEIFDTTLRDGLQVEGVSATVDDKLIMFSIYDGDFDVQLKDDLSPLTEADRASHEIIRNRLMALDDGLPVLSEESPPEEIEHRSSWTRYWLVDPLDGTKEFVKRNGEFTVNIALIDGNRAVMGVELAPAMYVEYTGAVELGAWKRNGDAQARSISATFRQTGDVRVVVSEPV